MEGPIYGGKFAFQNRLGWSYSWKEIYRFCFGLRGTYIWRGDLTEGFLRYEFWGLRFGEAYFRNLRYRHRSCLSASGICSDYEQECRLRLIMIHLKEYVNRLQL